MTPLDRAMFAFEGTVGRDYGKLEAACLAYVRALSEDAGTVEKVARQLCFMSIGGPEFQIRDPANDPFIDGNWKRHEDSARAALTALASRDERKE